MIEMKVCHIPRKKVKRKSKGSHMIRKSGFKGYYSKFR